MPKRETIFSSLDSFKAQFPDLATKPTETKRWQALEHYFAKGGVLSIASIPNNGDWPELGYPTPLKLKGEIDRLEQQRKDLEKRLGGWKDQKTQAQWSDTVNELKKFTEPLYWKHLQKYYSNVDYRKDADAVKLPVKLVSQNRWKPMIKMFVNDLEYRKQLADTVQNSVVYAKDKRVAKFADQQKVFRLESSQKNLELVQKKLGEINFEISMLREIEAWAKK